MPASHEESHTGAPSSAMAFSSSLLHNAAFRHMWDTEGCPVYSIHISCGLAQKLVTKSFFFPLLQHSFPQQSPLLYCPTPSRADFSWGLRGDIHCFCRAGFRDVSPVVPREGREWAQGPTLVHRLLHKEHSSSPAQGWIWVTSPSHSCCSMTPISLLTKSQGCSKLGPGSNIWAPGALPPFSGEMLPQAASLKQLVGQEELAAGIC